MEKILQDVRYGSRMLRKNPAFTLVAVLTLALAIGANTAIFSVVNAVLLKSLPFPHSEQLIVLDEYQTHTGSSSVAWPNFLDWRQRSHSFEGLAAFRGDSSSLTGVGDPTRLKVGEVSAAFFPLLGVKPVLGRTFAESEDQAHAEKAVVVGYEFWRTALHGDASVIGRSLTLDGEPREVIGVLPAGFKFFVDKIDVYSPIGLHADDRIWLDRGNHEGFRVLARLKDGVSTAAADRELDIIMRQLEVQYPHSNSGQRARVQTLYQYRLADVQPVLYTLMGAVLCVLLIGCANVANLLQSRAVGRHKEFAIRAAVGAPRMRIVRQMLTESILLGVLGGVVGLLLAPWALAGLLKLAPHDVPRLVDAGIDAGVLLYTLAISMASSVLFGMMPALQSARLSVAGAIKETSQTTTAGRSRYWLRSGLFVAEVALALLLIVPCGLMLRSLIKAQAVAPGFSPDHVLAMDISLPYKQYPKQLQKQMFYEEALRQVRTVPGVVSAGAVLCPPSVGQCWGSVFELSDRPIPKQSELPTSVFNVADADYFRTMQIGIREGRFFGDGDRADTPPVVVVNQKFARAWWPHGGALGKRIKQGFPQDDTSYREIVGVVDDVKQDGPDSEQKPEVYMPITQNPVSSVTFVLKTAGSPMDYAKPATAAIRQVDGQLPVSAIQPLAQYLADSLAQRTFSTLLLNLFGGLAIALAAIGIYGVMAYSVAQRTHEIGIRMALGARPGDVLQMVVGGGARLMAVGIGLGLLCALAAAHLLRGLLFGVSSNDPLTLIGVLGILITVVLLACFIPARRATQVDPMIALRYE